MNWDAVVIWGFAATLVLTLAISAAQGLRLTRIDLTFILGAMFTDNRDRAKVIGFVFHLVNGWLFATLYCLAFNSIHRPSWWLGAIFGTVHGLVVLVIILPLLPAFHRRMASEFAGPTPTRELEPPGFMALNYGYRTPLVTIVAHVMYGAVLGGFYRLTG